MNDFDKRAIPDSSQALPPEPGKLEVEAEAYATKEWGRYHALHEDEQNCYRITKEDFLAGARSRDALLASQGERIKNLEEAAKESGPIGWLDFAARKDWNGDWEYFLEKLKEKFEVREICQDGFLVIDRPKRDVGDWMWFAVMAWHCESEDGVTVSPQFYGEGPSGTLREPRHFQFGDEGYLFYPNAKVITAGLEALKEFYDFR